ncbi:MAG: STAS-like domain-containing protein [bacterium]
MCTIKIKDLIDGRSFPDAGAVLYDNIVSNIDAVDTISIDMSDVDALPSMFLNMSIGRFIDNFGFEKLKEKVVFKKINKSQAARIKDYILKVRTSK